MDPNDSSHQMLAQALAKGLIDTEQLVDLLKHSQNGESVEGLLHSLGVTDALQRDNQENQVAPVHTQVYGAGQTDAAVATRLELQSPPLALDPQQDSSRQTPSTQRPQQTLAAPADPLPDSWADPSGGAPARPAVDDDLEGEEEYIDYFPGSADRYDLQQEFARGGLGVVWVAEDLNMGRKVAVKKLLSTTAGREDLVERFEYEARVAGQLNHPGIVPVYEVGNSVDGSPFYVMKFLEGKTLGDCVEQFHQLQQRDPQRTLEFNRLLNIFRDVCNAVGFAHDRGVIHRDLKPENVMVGTFGEVTLVDWGIAKPIEKEGQESVLLPATVNLGKRLGTLVPMDNPQATLDTAVPHETSHEHGRGSSGDSTAGKSAFRSSRSTVGTRSSRNLTVDGSVLGTPAFMSPEQAAGKVGELDGRSDVFALGAVLYAILVGSPPFLGNNLEEVLRNVRSNRFPRPRESKRSIPRGLEAICLKAMATDPDDRYETARELADDVERWRAGEAVRAFREPWWMRVRRWTRKHEAMVLATCVALVGICLMATVASFAVRRAHRDELQARVVAERARDSEIAARQHEAQAKQIATDRLADARDAIDQWLVRLSGDLQFYPGLDKIRHWLLKRAEQDYEHAATYDGQDPGLLAESARCRLRLGDVQRLRGETEPALESYRIAGATFRKLTQSPPANSAGVQAEYRLQLANSQLGCTLALSQLARHAEAREQIQQAEAALQSLVRSNVDNRDMQSSLARTLIAAARLKDSDAAERVKQLNQARRWLDRLTIENARPKDQVLFVRVLEELAQARTDQKQFAEALRLHQQAVEAYDRMIAESPERPDHYESRATEKIKLANLYRRQHAARKATAFYVSATEDFELLIKVLYGRPYFSENLAVAHTNLAQMMIGQGENRAAQQRLLAAKNEFAGLIQHQGQQPRLLLQFASCCRSLARAQALIGQARQARSSATKAVEVVQHLHRKDPPMADATRLADYQIELAHILQQEAKREEAGRQLDAAAKTLASLPAEAGSTRGLLLARIEVARVRCLEDRQGNQARRRFAAALAHLRTVDGSLDTQLEARRLLAWVRLHAVGSTRDAKAAEQIARELTGRRHPSQIDWTLLGAALQRQERWSEARSAFSRAIQVAPQAAVEARLRLAMIEHREGQNAAAKATFEAGNSLRRSEFPGDQTLAELSRRCRKLLSDAAGN